MAELFALEDLPAYLQVPGVDNATATLVREAAYADLQDATGLVDWPSPVPLRLKHWALRLAAIAYNNPTAVTSEGIDDYRVTYEDRQRRREVLEAAARVYNSAGKPQGSFPEPDWHWASTVSTAVLPD